MTNGSESGPWITGPPPPPPEPEEAPTVAMGAEAPQPGPSRPTGWDWREQMRVVAIRARGMAPNQLTDSLYLLGAGAILVAFVLGWVDAVLLAVRHQPGLTAQDRALGLFSIGTVVWAVILLLGTALVAVGRRLDMSVSPRAAELVLTGLILASALTVAAAVFAILVDLTNFGHGIDAAFSDIMARLAAGPVAAAAGWWAWRMREEPQPPA